MKAKPTATAGTGTPYRYGSGPVQVAYFVNDVCESARQMNERFGAGPFHVIRRIELASAEHRGLPCRFVHTSAYGQWGAVMLELVQQDEEGPSPFRDLFGPGQEGLHHMAFFVSSLTDAIEAHARQGMPLATLATTTGGVTFAFVDAAATLGHMIELYEPETTLARFYEHVRESSLDWNGDTPVRFL